MVIPTLAPSDPCPVTTDVSTPSSDLGLMLGKGVARPVELGASALLGIGAPKNFSSEEWGGNKDLWGSVD